MTNYPQESNGNEKRIKYRTSNSQSSTVIYFSFQHLPDDIQFQVEDALNQFESSDFQVSKASKNNSGRVVCL